ncbi:hypothetical protein [Flavobacteriaceae bacterium 14752]|uniref:hypothetical protein n=1 Tax=Mesohalobacter salilacus TaxID=2491711 RepID=UPI000F63F584|nr:hypothetical protein EIG84_05765 [Flavobacteriaceae bacterium 14752]
MSKKIPNIKERVLYISENVEDSKRIFFEKVGLKYSNFTGKSKLSDLNSSAVAEILLIYKQINPYWLITGEGEMLNGDGNAERINQNEMATKDKLIKSLEDQVQLLKESLAECRKRNKEHPTEKRVS